MTLVYLVGRDEEDNENLGMRYVAAALVEAGFEVRLSSMVGPSQVEKCAAEVLESRPLAVGLALSDVHTLIDMVVFAALLRRRGYRGHITAGGALATLIRCELLERHAALDSIVRHAGELPMVELCRRLEMGLKWSAVPGLTTRLGDGQPAPPLPNNWATRRPLRAQVPSKVLGVPVARLVGSRGCLGSCHYCSSVSLRKDEVCEAIRGGYEPEVLRAMGVGGRRRRRPEDLADEAAELYHGRGVRIFHLLDDNLVGGDDGASVGWLRALVAALEERGVQGVAWSLMIDPGSVTPAMLDALEALGVVRVLVGVEALSDESLRALGRRGDAGVARRAVADLQARGIVVLFNSIAVHPDATEASILSELDALEGIEGAHVDVNPMVVYPRSAVMERLCAAGRASGGSLGYLYQSADPIATRFASLLIRLGIEAPVWTDVSQQAHELATMNAIATRLGLGRGGAEVHGFRKGRWGSRDAHRGGRHVPAGEASLKESIHAVVEAVRRVRFAALRQLLALSQTTMSGSQRLMAFRSVLSTLTRDLQGQRRRIVSLEARLAATMALSRSELGTFRTRATLAGAVILVAAGCGGNTATVAGAAGSSSTAGSGNLTSGGGTSAGGANGSAGGMASGGSLPVATRAVDCRMGEWLYDGEPNCSSDATCSEVAALRDSIATCGGMPEDESWRLTIDSEGRLVAASSNNSSAELASCVDEALRNEQFPCVADGEIWWSAMYGLI